MASVSVAALKSRLSAYLARVQKGHEIIVTSHRQPIARVVPLATAPDIGLIRAKKPAASLRKIRGIRLKIDPVEFLFADRRRR